MPLVSPATVGDVAPVVVAVRPPGEAVTAYAVIASPPSFAGAIQLTTASVFPAVAVGAMGASGAVSEDSRTAASSSTKLVWAELFSIPVKESEIVWPA